MKEDLEAGSDVIELPTVIREGQNISVSIVFRLKDGRLVESQASRGRHSDFFATILDDLCPLLRSEQLVCTDHVHPIPCRWSLLLGPEIMLATNLHLAPSYTSLPQSPLRQHDNFLQSANYKIRFQYLSLTLVSL